jgi:hypothetical protein
MDAGATVLLGKPEVAILVVSCDAYQDLWNPFFSCLFKYWPDCPYPIYLGSNFLEYLDARVKPILVGPDLDYTSNLINMLNQIEQEWVIIWIEDRVLSAQVDTIRITNLIKSAQSQQASYLKLIAIHPFAYIKEKTQEIGEIPRGVRYRVSMTVALWNKSFLLKILCPGETAWDIERRGSQRTNEFNAKFFCPSIGIRKNPPLHAVHLVIKGRLLRDALKFLKQEGLQDYIKKWPKQTIASFFYVKAYIALLDLSSKLRSQYFLNS